MRKINYIFSLILLFTGLISGQERVYFNPEKSEVTNETTITVGVYIENTEDLIGYSIKVGFNDDVLELTQITRTTFLRQYGNSSIQVNQPSIEFIIDSVSVDERAIGVSSETETVPINGSGMLFSLTFDVLKPGRTDLQFFDIDLVKVEHFYLGVKVFLEGPYQVPGMDTQLNQSGLIPVQQPYNADTFNYNGTETKILISNDIVDWVLVTLYSGTPGTLTIEQQKAGLLLKDGNIVDPVTGGLVKFYQRFGSYYVSVRHRNHLGVMSAEKLLLNSQSSFNYDFTSGAEKAYGTKSLKMLTSGVYGMYAGDTDADGVLNANDRNYTWNLRNTGGYLGADTNLSGSVDAPDRNNTWNNRNAGEQIPD